MPDGRDSRLLVQATTYGANDMSAERTLGISPRMQTAVGGLKETIRLRYPDARFPFQRREAGPYLEAPRPILSLGCVTRRAAV